MQCGWVDRTLKLPCFHPFFGVLGGLSVFDMSSGLLAAGGEFLSISWTVGPTFCFIVNRDHEPWKSRSMDSNIQISDSRHRRSVAYYRSLKSYVM